MSEVEDAPTPADDEGAAEAADLGEDTEDTQAPDAPAETPSE